MKMKNTIFIYIILTVFAVNVNAQRYSIKKRQI